jgi:hypothetical protein
VVLFSLLAHLGKSPIIAVVVDCLTGGEPLYMVNNIDSVNATGAADVALAH